MSVKVSFHDIYFYLFVANFRHYAAREMGFSLNFDILIQLISKGFDINLMHILMRIIRLTFACDSITVHTNKNKSLS